MPSTSPETTEQTAETPPLTPDEFRATVARLRRNTNRVEGSGCLAIIINMIAVGLGLTWWWINGANSYLWVAAFVVLINALTTRVLAHSVRKDQDDIERLLKFIENTQDVNILGTILELNGTAGHPGDIFGEVHRAADTTVERLLRSLQSGDEDALNTQQRKRLRRGLFHRSPVSDIGYWRGPQYCLLVLAALEQIGDKRDLSDIERLLKQSYITDEIRVNAERCALVIRERVAREEGRDILLRPERKPETVDTLLRPSAEQSDTPPEQLLRASVADQSDTSA